MNRTHARVEDEGVKMWQYNTVNTAQKGYDCGKVTQGVQPDAELQLYRWMMPLSSPMATRYLFSSQQSGAKLTAVAESSTLRSALLSKGPKQVSEAASLGRHPQTTTFLSLDAVAK